MKPIAWKVLFLLVAIAAASLPVLAWRDSPERDAAWVAWRLRRGPGGRVPSVRRPPLPLRELAAMARSGKISHEAIDEAALGLLRLDLSGELSGERGPGLAPLEWIRGLEREGLLSFATWEAYVERLLGYLLLADTAEGAALRLRTQLQDGALPDTLRPRVLGAFLERALRGIRDPGDDRGEYRAETMRVARLRGELSQDSWAAYIRGTTRLALRAREVVRRARGVPILAVLEHPERFGSHCYPRGEVLELLVDGEPWALEALRPRQPPGGEPEGKPEALRLARETQCLLDPRPAGRDEPLAPGDHTISLRLRIEATFANPENAELPPVIWEDEVSSRFSVVSEESPAVRRVDPKDPLYAQVATTIPGAVDITEVIWSERDGELSFRTSVECGCSAVALAFDIIWRTPAREVTLGSVFREPCHSILGRTGLRHWQERATRPSQSFDPAWFWSGKIDLVLRPSEELAEREPEGTTIWGEPVTIEGVRLVRTAGSARR